MNLFSVLISIKQTQNQKQFSKRKTLSNKLFTNVLVIEESICRIVQSKRDNPNKKIDFSKYPYFTKQLNSEQNAISKQ